jgi:hypothetical protein
MNKLLLIKIIVVLILLFSNQVTVAHQETSISHGLNGELKELPKEFQPASFCFKKNELQISGKIVEFSAEIMSLFPDRSNASDIDLPKLPEFTEELEYDITFLSSWYHGPSLTPPYLKIFIVPKSKDFKFVITVDIENIKVMRSEIFVTPIQNPSRVIRLAITTPFDAENIRNEKQDSTLIIGKWSNQFINISITESEIQSTINEESVYPTGSISEVRPGVMKLMLANNDAEEFTYSVRQDILELSFVKDPHIALARQGSPTEIKWEERNASVP